jgi:rhamnose utilization protein RhaD (predicted bifunctional aldolase and dehydrogenase)
VIEHVKLKSQEMATAQMLQQTGGQPLNAEQELQLESMTAKINAEEFQKLKQLSAQVSGQGQQGPDPLIQLKQQELQMDQQKMQQDAQMDQAELQIDQQRMQNKATEFQQRLASQERQTKARIDAAMQRELLKKGE